MLHAAARMLALTASILTVGMFGAAHVRAQDAAGFPNKPIQVIVPFPAGVGVDVVVRIIGPRLGASLGQSVVVENRPGAGGNIGHDLAARAPKDGYTLLGTASNFVANPSLYRKVNYDPLKDFVPVIGLIRTPSVLVVPADSPIKSVQELIALAKASPGKISYASGGNGSMAHFSGELFKTLAGVDMLHVPYKGAPDIMTSLLGKQTDLAFPVLVSVLPQLKAGTLRALGVTSTKRSPQLPDVPTMYEVMNPGFDIESENGMVAPAGVRPEVVAKLNAEIVKILRDPAVSGPLIANGFEVVGSTPAEFGARLKNDVAKFADIVSKSGAKVD
ncbi:MAG: tripartite tricarboxylate transporter substrate binding protein [Betaproteobacteria bacterium]|nr:tripartite tricarboxylate transporter substrate binding protein [Betaproteobacteria bacterium]